MPSIIPHDNHLLVFAILVGAAALGIYSEHKKWFGKISGILVTMISMSILAMIGVVPIASSSDYSVPAYNLVFDYFVPISIPLLLFSSNIKKIIRESGKLLIAFIIGAIGVVIGCFIAAVFIHLGDNSGNTAGVIAATLVGGSINFMATGEILNFSTSPLFTATVAVDNFVANLYVLLLFLIPSLSFLARFFAKSKNKTPKNESDVQKAEKNEYPMTFERFAVSLLVALAIAVSGNLLAEPLQNMIGTDLDISILLITIIAILAANIFPKQLQKLENTAFSIGLWMMYLFLATIGAATNIGEIFEVGLGILGFYLIIMFIHLLLVIFTARIFKLDVYEVIIASSANIMGPSVAAPMAASLGQKKLVTPAILVGILGYVIGTFLGVSIAMVL